jgi:hypothetical protein
VRPSAFAAFRFSSNSNLDSSSRYSFRTVEQMLDTFGETEVGDLCNLQTMTTDNYTVQQVWSQNACGCK